MPTAYSAVVIPASDVLCKNTLDALEMRFRIFILVPLLWAGRTVRPGSEPSGSFGSRSAIPSWVHQACAAICGRQRAPGRDVYKWASTDSYQRAGVQDQRVHGVLDLEPMCQRGRLVAELRSARQTPRGRPQPVRAHVAQPARRHQTHRPPPPLHQRAAPRPPEAHPDDSHPAAAPRRLRPRPTRTHTRSPTWVMHPAIVKTTPDLNTQPRRTLWPGRLD